MLPRRSPRWSGARSSRSEYWHRLQLPEPSSLISSSFRLSLRWNCLTQRNKQGEAAPTPRPGGVCHAAAMGLSHTSRQRQSQPRARNSAGQRIVAAAEWLKDRLALAERDTRSPIQDFDASLSARRLLQPLNPHQDLSAAVLLRVGEKVEDDLRKGITVAQHRQALRMDLQRQVRADSLQVAPAS